MSRNPTRQRGRPIAALALAMSFAAAAGLGGVDGTSAALAAETIVFRPDARTGARFGIGSIEDASVLWQGYRLHVELHRPVLATGAPVPERLPVILLPTPYGGAVGDQTGKIGDPMAPTFEEAVVGSLRDYFVPRGYAVATTHLLGTGQSDGCFAFGGDDEVAATLAVVEALAKAPWSTGRIGLIGGSYDAGAVMAAATSPASAARHIAAVAVSATQSGAYEFITAGDGVPIEAQNPGTLLYPAAVTAVYSPPSVVGDLPDRSAACTVEATEAAEEIHRTGNFSAWAAPREWRSRMANLRAATLMIHGVADTNVYPTPTVGSFERIPRDVPKRLVIGQWAHRTGEEHRGDIRLMHHAWFDRHLRRLPVELRSWPMVQVADVSGRWRAVESWPASSDIFGHLDLAQSTVSHRSADGRLEPSAIGASFSEDTEALVFEWPMPDGLRITGVAVADLSVLVRTPTAEGAAHVAAVLEGVDRDGGRVGAPSFWARSVRHLDAIDHGWFRQAAGTPAHEGRPFRLPIRLTPNDLTVPTGGTLRLTVSGTLRGIVSSATSGAHAKVTVEGGCSTPSVLRFRMADPDDARVSVLPPATTNPPLVTVPEVSAPAASIDTDIEPPAAAMAPICGRAPIEPETALLGRP